MVLTGEVVEQDDQVWIRLGDWFSLSDRYKFRALRVLNLSKKAIMDTTVSIHECKYGMNSGSNDF